MANIDITISIPEAVYQAVDAALKANKVQRPDPNNPDRLFLEPVQPSVEAFLEDIIEKNIAPVVRGAVVSADVVAIEAEIAAKQKELEGKRKAIQSVRRAPATGKV
jgi:hypothetical protein